MKQALIIIAVTAVITAGIVITLYEINWYGSDNIVEKLDISDQTKFRTAEDIDNYEPNDEIREAREITRGRLIGAAEGDFVAPERIVEYEVIYADKMVTLEFSERGGGVVWIDTISEYGEINWGELVLDVQCEFMEMPDGRLGATLSTTNDEFVLMDPHVYAPDNWKEERWTDRIHLIGGAGGVKTLDDRYVARGSVGVGYEPISLTYDWDKYEEAVMINYSWHPFK